MINALRGINTFFARGLGPIVHVWDKILKWEAKLKQGTVQNVDVDGTNMTFDSLKIDIADLRKGHGQRDKTPSNGQLHCIG